MSHFTTLRSRLTDIEILKVSLRDLGIAVQTNAEVRGAGCQRVQADVVAVLEGGYDLGWSYSAQGSLVNQKYAVNKTLAEVKRPGLQNAHVKLVMQH